MLYFKIDENGKFVEPVLLDAPPMITKIITDKENNKAEIQIADPQYITKRPPNGLHNPTWNEEKQEWENGISVEEIEKRRNVPKQLTTNERVDELEGYIVEMIYENTLKDFGF